jgi:hypothetical protein
MTLDRILQAAVNDIARGRREPSCFRAHVMGEGYVNDGTNPDTRDEYIRQAARAAQQEIENMGIVAPHYSEPGYSNPKHGIVFADWNNLPGKLGDILERAGYSCEWSDEWTTCDECNGAVRTSPDSYSWERSYTEGDGYIVCAECTDWADYCRQHEDDANHAVPSSVDPADHGYSRLSKEREYENGWHPGQTDEPKAILAGLHANGIKHVLFRVAGVGQFDVSFETWVRDADDDEAEA